MRMTGIGGFGRWMLAVVCAWLALPVFPAQAHGVTPALLAIFFGALLAHVATPVVLLSLKAFRGRRGTVFGIYAVVMAAYYFVMWAVGSGEMFVFPVFPVALAALLYFLLGKVPEAD